MIKEGVHERVTLTRNVVAKLMRAKRKFIVKKSGNILW